MKKYSKLYRISALCMALFLSFNLISQESIRFVFADTLDTEELSTENGEPKVQESNSTSENDENEEFNSVSENGENEESSSDSENGEDEESSSESDNDEIDEVSEDETETETVEIGKEKASRAKKSKAATIVADANYIYLDINAGTILINGNNYTGYVYCDGNLTKITGTNNGERSYYIYQSTNDNKDKTGYVSDENGEYTFILPSYEEVTYNGESWSDYITGNEDVKAIINNWKTAAAAAGRTATSTPEPTEYSKFYETDNETLIYDQNEKNIVIYKSSATVVLDNLYIGYNECNILKSGLGYNWGENAADKYVNSNKLSSSNPFGSIIVIENDKTGTEDYKVTLELKGDSRLRNIYYSNQTDGKGSLKITSHEGEGSNSGTLTCAPMVDDLSVRESWPDMLTVIGPYFEEEYGLTFGGGTVFAGFPGQDDNVWGDRYNVNFAVCIGGGNTKNGQVTITGGTLTAVSNGTAAAIGGGGAYLDAAGNGIVNISGGNVYAYAKGVNVKNSDGVDEYIPSVAIGGGSTCNKAAASGTKVTITGGNVVAKSMGGVAIGGGNSVLNVGGDAEITITGEDTKVEAVSYEGTINSKTVYAGNAIGGGNGTVGGEATVVIEDGTILATAIGGGTGDKKENASVDDIYNTGKGGKATVKVTGGDTTLDNGIGGGNSRNSDGGDATVIITGGTINAGQYIGGGTGCIEASDTDGNGGNATIYITGGDITTGIIGGGDTDSISESSHIGYARAYISGGEILGQFLLKGDINNDERCEFIMTGGTIENVKAIDEKYPNRQPNGGAVWMDDDIGIVTISGGTITKCSAQNGGAVYMTNGTFTLTGTGIISDCEATGNGGAVYLGGGRAVVGVDRNLDASNVKILDYIGLTPNETEKYAPLDKVNITLSLSEINCSITGCKAECGGALYVEGDAKKSTETSTKNSTIDPAEYNVYVSAGSVSRNTASTDGGGISVKNGHILMDGGTIDNNEAKSGNGGGIYLSSGASGDARIRIRSGYLTDNKAGGNGGAIAVNGIDNSDAVLKVTIGVNESHYGSVSDSIQDSNFIGCDHINDGITDYKENQIYSSLCPEIINNTASQTGGAIYLSGDSNSLLNIYCLEESGNKALGDKQLDNKTNEVIYYQSDFLMVEGGKTIISTGTETSNASGKLGHVNISGTIHVMGGTLDIYGHMSNPNLDGMITVDLNDEDDYFEDHRIYIDQATDGTKIYWIHYYENFPTVITDDNGNEVTVRTGRFRAFPIKADGNGKYTEEILDQLFYRDGYDILGWNTDKEGKLNWYEAGDNYDFETNEDYEAGNTLYKMIQTHKEDSGKVSDLIRNDDKGQLTTLVLYAIWGRYKIVTGEGIEITSEDKDSNGNLTITATTEEGYHFYNYSSTVEVKMGDESLNDSDVKDYTQYKDTEDESGENVTTTLKVESNDLTGSVITITLQGAAKDATITAKSINDQVFTDFEDEDTAVSVDSSFTTQFTVKDYIPVEYSSQILRFGKTLPAASRIILKKDDNYWYYILGSETDSVDLSCFYKMGTLENGGESFTYDTTTEPIINYKGLAVLEDDTLSNFTYQFIVDFSQVSEDDRIKLSETDETMTVDLEFVPKGNAPAIPKEDEHFLYIGLREVSQFDLQAKSNALSTTLTFDYKASKAEKNETGTSIWKNRKMALVLTAPDNVPNDIWITVGDDSEKLYMNSDRQFIIPTSKLFDTDISMFEDLDKPLSISITLGSNMFQEGEIVYEFGADWYVSDSSKATSPLNNCVPQSTTITFTSNNTTAPSLRIAGTNGDDKLYNRLIKESETLKVNISYKDIPTDAKITATLQINEGSGFQDIQGRDGVELTYDDNESNIYYEMPINGMDTGSYSLLVTVTKDGEELLNVPYYFIVVNDNGNI